MNIGNILKKVGTGIITQVFPAAGAVIDVVNGFLGDDKKLPTTATGDQVQNAINSLSPTDRAAIMSKELDVKIAEIEGWSNVVDSLAKADATGSSTRPHIALVMAYSVAVPVAAFSLTYGYAVFADKPELIKAMGEAWPIMAAVLATPTALLRAYFGLRTEEKKARYANSIGHQPESPKGFAGIFKNIFG